MKKLLALTLALTMSAAMFASCGESDDGDSSSKADNKSSAAAKDESSEEEKKDESSEEESSKDESSEDESSEDESSEGEGGDTEEGPEGLDVLVSKLKGYDTASLKFALDTDVSKFIAAFNQEDGNGVHPGEPGYAGQYPEALINIDVQDVGGVPMVRLSEEYYQWKDADGNIYEEPTEGATACSYGRKINIDLDFLFAGHEEDLAKIDVVKVDLVAIAREHQFSADGEDYGLQIGWMGGEMGPNNVADWSNNYASFSMASDHEANYAWTNQWAYTSMEMRPHLENDGPRKFGDAGNEHNYLYLQTWGFDVPQQIDFYIADISFEQEDGTVIEIDPANLPGGASYDAIDVLSEIE